MIYLSFEAFKSNAIRNSHVDPDGKLLGHWTDYEERWGYHQRAIELIARSNVTSPNQILNLGSMGAPLVHGSLTMDYDKNWNPNNHYKVDFIHDARQFPWPFKDNQFEWFIALRVFHHLYPAQCLAFREARRIAKNVLIVVPQEVSELAKSQRNRTDAGITVGHFCHWNNDVQPVLMERCNPSKYGYLYVFDSN